MSLLDNAIIEGVNYPDLVFENEGGWYFLDETYSNPNGPYETEEGARNGLDRYVHYLETGEVL